MFSDLESLKKKIEAEYLENLLEKEIVLAGKEVEIETMTLNLTIGSSAVHQNGEDSESESQSGNGRGTESECGRRGGIQSISGW